MQRNLQFQFICFHAFSMLAAKAPVPFHICAHLLEPILQDDILSSKTQCGFIDSYISIEFVLIADFTVI